MQHIQFLLILEDNISLFLFVLLFNAVLFYIIGRKLVRSIIDPLSLALVFVVFANTIPPFLFFTGNIKSDNLIYFEIFEIVFWSILYIFSLRKKQFSKKNLVNEYRIGYLMYFICFFIYLVLIVFTYIYLGIPLFLPSRLSLFVNSGLGSIERLLPFLQIYCLIFSFYLLNKSSLSKLTRIFIYFVFLTFVVTAILSGSKSGMIPFFTAIFGFYYIYKKQFKVNRRFYGLLVLSSFSAIVVLVLSQELTFLEALSEFSFRFIGSGDVYWMGLPNSVYKDLKIDNSYTYLFSGILSPLRLIDAPAANSGLGFQLAETLNPGLDVLMGPNMRPSLLGKILFGWGGIIFSAFLALFLSFIMYELPRFMPKGILSSIYYTYIYVTILSFISDPVYSIGLIMNIIFCTFFFLLLIVFCESFLESGMNNSY
jgi:hypothetical protein